VKKPLINCQDPPPPAGQVPTIVLLLRNPLVKPQPHEEHGGGADNPEKGDDGRLGRVDVLGHIRDRGSLGESGRGDREEEAEKADVAFVHFSRYVLLDCFAPDTNAESRCVLIPTPLTADDAESI